MSTTLWYKWVGSDEGNLCISQTYIELSVCPPHFDTNELAQTKVIYAFHKLCFLVRKGYYIKDVWSCNYLITKDNTYILLSLPKHMFS